VYSCIASLKVGCEKLKRASGGGSAANASGLHADLFLVRHLLALREQLAPFESKLVSVDKSLDFAPTATAWQKLLNTTRHWITDSSGIMQFAQHGLPALSEKQLDAKKDLDAALKTSCISLKSSALKMLVGPLDGFLAKVSAFAGEIPIGNDGKNSNDMGAATVLMDASAAAALKAQSFVRPERIKEVLDTAHHTIVINAADLKQVMRLYIDNDVARNILLKPILAEFDIYRKKTVRS
jgi:hypothetical protein